MKTFYYIRHGQTDANVKSVYSGGAIDIPLNATGIQQAEDLSIKISKDLGIDRIFCSPLGRTRKTCEIVNRNIQVPVEVREELKEWLLGDVDGQSYDFMPCIRQTACDPPNGETREKLFARVALIVKEIESSPETLFIVAHAQVWRALCVDLGIELNHIKNCILYKVTLRNGKWEYAEAFPTTA